MKKIRNLTITFLSFIIMLCIAIGLSLCFPAQESSVLAETSTQKTLTGTMAKDYPALAKGTRYIVGPVSMRDEYANVGTYGITYVTYDNNETFFSLRTDEGGEVCFEYVKVNAINWPSDGMVHLIIPKEVTNIEPETRTDGETDANKRTFHQSELNVYSIEFETGSKFSVLGDIDADGEVEKPELNLKNGRVFGINSNLRKITFPDNGKNLTIGNYAFYQTTARSSDGSVGLQSVRILNKTSVTIGKNAFQNCVGLRTFDADLNCSEASSIGEEVFTGCRNLYRAVLPGGLTTVAVKAFMDCSLLSDVLIPETVKSIATQAFANSGLVRVKLPDGVSLASSSGVEAFSNCANLVEVETSKTFDQFWDSNYGTKVFNVVSVQNSSNILRTAEGLVFAKANADGIKSCMFINNTRNYVVGNWYIGGYASPTATSNKWNTFDKLVLPDNLDGNLSVYELNYVSDVYEDEYNGKQFDYLAIKGSAGNYEVDFVVNDRTSLNVEKYDIASRVFENKYAPYVVISSAVEKIGDYAFNGSRLTSLVVGENVSQIGTGAFQTTDNSLSTVYIKNNKQNYGTAFNGAEPTSSNPVYFIYESKSAFEDRAVEVNYYTNIYSGQPHKNNVIHTYIVPVTYYVDEKAHTEERLHGKEYDFVRRDNNLWGIDYNITALHNLAEEFFGEDACTDYASTKWYKEEGYENEADKDYVDTQLADDVAQINVYTHKVTKADNAKVVLSGTEATTGWTYDENTSWENKNDDVKISISYTNIANKSETATELKNAGEYTVEFTLAEKWGEWAQSATVSITIEQQRIALSAENYKWKVNGADFQQGTVYSSNNKYTTYQVNGATSYNNVNFVAYKNTSDTYTVSIALSNNALKLIYTDDSVNCNLNGAYTTSVEVSAINENNYNISGVLNSTVTWYIAEYANAIKEGFEIGDFTYGDTSVNFHVPEPEYKSGTGTAITFTLKRSGETDAIVSDTAVTDAKGYAYYVNSSMPVGGYELTVTVGAATTENITYVGYSYRYDFKVSKASFDTTAANALVAELNEGHEFAVGGTASLYGDTVVSALTALDRTLIKPASTTFWGEVGQAEFFADSVDFCYSTAGGNYVTFDGTVLIDAIGKYTVYYNIQAANYNDLVNVQNATERDDHSYSLVIYQNMAPFDYIITNSLTWVSAGVEVKPTVTNDSRYSISWSSKEVYSNAGEHTVTLTSNDTDLYRWNITDTTKNGFTVSGDEETITFTYELQKANNNFIMNPTMSGWIYGQFGSSGITLSFRPMYFDYVEGQSHPYTVKFYEYSDTAEGNKGAELDFSLKSAWSGTSTGRITFSGDVYTGLNNLTVGKYVVEVVFADSSNFTKALSKSCTFEVSKGINSFSELRIAGWAWNTFSTDNNLPAISLLENTTALGSKFVTLTFTNGGLTNVIKYAYDSTGRKFYNADNTECEDIKTFFNGFTAGLWTLTAVAPENDDVGETTSTIQFSVIIAENGWVTAPSILSWEFGDTHNFTAGETIHKGEGGAELTRTYYSNTAKTDVITNLDSYLNNLSAGNYTFVVSVAGVAGKFASMDYVLNFSIAPGEFNWQQGSGTTIEAYQPKLNITNPVYGSTNGLAVTLPNGTANTDYSYTTTYYKVINGQISGSGSTTAPKDAGSYAVVVTINKLKGDGTADGNYNAYEETLYFSIAQKVSSFNGTNEAPAPVNGSTESRAYDSISIPTVAVVDANEYALSYVVALQGDSARAAAASKTCIDAQEVVDFIKENGIGTYTVTFTAKSKNNNYADFRTVTTYVISMAQNGWTKSYASASATYGENPGLEAFTAKGGDIVYSIGENSYDTIVDLNGAIAGLPAGTHTVNVEIAARNWTALSDRFTLTVNRANDSWANAGQLNSGNLSWAWANPNVSFTRPTAQNGSEYAFVISNSSGATVATPADNDGVLTEIQKLDSGSYTLTVTASGNANYNSISTAFNFTINPAANEITSLSIEGWTYGAAANSPVYTANHGTAVITYEKQNGNGWVSVSSPVDAGTYRVIATVSQTGNYAAATKNAEFTIAKAEATISGLTIGGFQWNGYDKTTFVAATTNSPSAITYAVYSGTSKLFDLGLDANGLPDDESVEAMNGLVAGSYRLVASTALSTNYNATSTGADAGNFTVTAASNGWVITPNIRSWVHYEFDDEVNMPYAVPQYGSISVTIKNAEGATVYSGTISVTVENGEYVYSHTGNTAGLWNAPGGLYTLTVTVSGENNKYNGLTSSTVFDIFTGSISRPQNYWEEVPSIDSWTSEYQDYTTPAGVPNRWTTVTHKYYEAERTPNGFVSDLTLLATLTRTYVGAGSPDRIEVDGEMPAKPGWYMVVYTSAYEDDNGTVYEADALTYTVYFQILEAENSWVETPNIENWTLNSAASVPTTGSAMYDSEYVITYRPFDEPNAEPVSEIPTTAGRYVMIVTAKAKVDGKPSLYCKDIVSEVVFTVSLATNEWVVLPTLEGWSEEFSDQEHNPVAEAKAGTVTYYYYDSNHKLLEDKPTAAGTYYLVAEVEADGYEKLSSEVEFTITAAWDETLILIDMVLGVAACAATVVAIIFAKRRKSQC